MRRIIALLILGMALFAWAAPALADGISSPTVTRNQDGSVTISWSGGSGDVTIQRSDQGDQAYFGTYCQDIATVPASDGSFTDKTAAADKTYYYRLETYGILHIPGYTSIVTAAPNGSSSGQGNTNPAPVEDQGGMFEQIVASVVQFPVEMARSLGSTIGFKPLDQLVFLSGMSEQDKENAPWTASQINFIRLWYVALTGITLPFLLIAVMLTGFKLTASGVNPGMRAEAVDSMWRWFGSILIITLAPFLAQVLMAAVRIFLEGIQTAFQYVAQTAGIGGSISDWGGINFGGIELHTGSVLGTAFVKVAFVFIYYWINILYIIRTLVVSVMLCFTPIMAVMWAFNKNTTAPMVWLAELVSNAFMPVAHALVLCIILGFCDVKDISKGGSWVTILIFLYTMMPLAEVLRNSFQSLLLRLSGFNEEGAAMKMAGAALGLGGIFSLSRLGAATFGNNMSAGPDDTGPGAGGRLAPTVVQQSAQPRPFITSGRAGGLAPTITGEADTMTVTGAGDLAGGIPGLVDGIMPGVSPTGFGRETVLQKGAAQTTQQPRKGSIQNKAEGPQRAIPRWPRYAMGAAHLAGAAAAGVIHLAAGAAPGGQLMARPLVNGITATSRFAGAAGSMMGAAIHHGMIVQKPAGVKQSLDSVRQSLHQMTGVEDNSWRGTAAAFKHIARAGMAAAQSPHHGIRQVQSYIGNLQPAGEQQENMSQNRQSQPLQQRRIGFRPPSAEPQMQRPAVNKPPAQSPQTKEQTQPQTRPEPVGEGLRPQKISSRPPRRGLL